MTTTAAAVDEELEQTQADTTRLEYLPVGARFRLTLDEYDWHVTFVFGTVQRKNMGSITVVLESPDPQHPRPWDGKPITWARSTLVTRIPKLTREVKS